MKEVRVPVVSHEFYPTLSSHGRNCHNVTIVLLHHFGQEFVVDLKERQNIVLLFFLQRHKF